MWSWAFGPAFFIMSLLVEFRSSLKVDEFIMSSWTCLVKLGLRPSFLSSWAFLVEFLFSRNVDSCFLSSWTYLVKLGLRPSFFHNESSWLNFGLVWKFMILLRILGLVLWSWAFGPAFFLMSLLEWVSVWSECWLFYYTFLDLSCEAGPSAQLFS